MARGISTFLLSTVSKCLQQMVDRAVGRQQQCKYFQKLKKEAETKTNNKSKILIIKNTYLTYICVKYMDV